MSVERIIKRGKKISNRESAYMLSKFKEGYEYFLSKEKNSEIVRIDPNKSVEEVNSEIINKVYSKIL